MLTNINFLPFFKSQWRNVRSNGRKYNTKSLEVAMVVIMITLKMSSMEDHKRKLVHSSRRKKKKKCLKH